MKWSRNFMVSIVIIFACCFSQVKTATQEELAETFLRLYTGNNIEEYIDAHLEEAETLIHDIDTDNRTVLYIHGFTESINSSSVHTVINAYLERNDHNVLALDWSGIASENYLLVSSNVESVGKSVALALNDFVQAGLPSENIHVVGHSMGAQVAAHVGRNVDFSLQRITGLDPAGPLFHFIGRPLAASDARFVDIIHTDGGFYGNARIIGTVDFLPNGGRRIQPGCPILFSFLSSDDFCSHHRSWQFYSESLTKEKAFLAIQCKKNGYYARKRRDSIPIVMGYAAPIDAQGSYCLVTDSSSPYGLGIEGAHDA